jgi:uncharacterized protein YprB with RNaseH-like and TPR domain
MYWQQDEIELLKTYFTGSISEMNMFAKLQTINPDRTYEAMMRQIRRYREEGYERNRAIAIKKLRVGYLDIESSSLNADFGMILSWFIKREGKNQYDYSVIKKSEIFDYSFDKRVVEELLKAFANYDVLYTHYGADRRFDIPFIRTRAYAHNLQDKLPKYMDNFIMDTYPIAKAKLKLHSNRLGSIAEAVGVTCVKKTPLSGKTWQLAVAGHPGALAYIVKHNKADVRVLEAVHQKLKCIERPIYHSV